MYITECSVDKYADRTMAEIAREENADPFEKALDILLESRNNTMMIVFFMDPVDVSRAIANPNSMVCTDGFPSKKKSHPRYYGSCVRVLEKYVKQEHLLAAAGHLKMSGMPAAKLGAYGSRHSGRGQEGGHSGDRSGAAARQRHLQGGQGGLRRHRMRDGQRPNRR